MAFGASPPSEIKLVYRPVGESHVFTADGSEMRGFHISNPSLEVAFRSAAAGLGTYVSALYAIDAQYEIQCSFVDFQRHLESEDKIANFVIARIAQPHARPLSAVA